MGSNSTRDEKTPAANKPAKVQPEEARTEKVRPENVPADEVAHASSSPPPAAPPPDLLRLQLSSARLAEVGILTIDGPVERRHRYVLREVFD